MKRLFIAATAALLLSGCGLQSAQNGPIATVNISRITANWPKFINYNNQINADAAAIETAHISDKEKAQRRLMLQERFARLQQEVTDDVQSAAAQIAKDRHFDLVVTREFVGYGGVDITPDVEKALKIEEKAPSKT